MCDTSEKICIGFIGLGLIGGSIAKTLRKVHPEYKLMAYCRTKATIEEAIQEGVIDIALEERDDRFADCDYIFLCAPVSTNISYLPFVKGIAKPGCIITDVGSVKGEIHQAVETLGMTHQFIGGHPMAGSEKTGYSSATDYLLENAYYMITPGPDVEIATVSAFVDLVQSLKAIPMVLTYEEHDYITAGVRIPAFRSPSEGHGSAPVRLPLFLFVLPFYCSEKPRFPVPCSVSSPPAFCLPSSPSCFLLSLSLPAHPDGASQQTITAAGESPLLTVSVPIYHFFSSYLILCTRLFV